ETLQIVVERQALMSWNRASPVDNDDFDCEISFR
ncbi:hypothetical protein CEXT_673621, partial [Caerostris extrusa]